MNILNGNDLFTVASTCGDFMCEIEDAETLLRCCWERFFGSSEIPTLDAGDALEIGKTLQVCCDRIYAALLTYRLTVGEEGHGVGGFFDLARDYSEARELQELNDAIFNRARDLPAAASDALTAKRLEALRLPIAESVAKLREVLKDA